MHRALLLEAHTVVLGSGAAGLCAAVRLWAEGIPDVALLTESLDGGTSINTGSDKQTYYKMGMHGAEADSPRLLAETLFDGGSMHGDLALVEAALSVRCFSHLANLGVAFPSDAYGQFAGYKTDHDPKRRATSCGPYTSRDMCRALIRQVRRLDLPVYQKRTAARLLTVEENGVRRAAGVQVFGPDGPETWKAENVVFAVGGPGGLYARSVYPEVHTGAIGLALEAGALAQNLPEAQYGLASTKFRWNVSGTYMQVLPRIFSTDADGHGERDFLRPAFADISETLGMIFLKGYQWPFDVRKAADGSSRVDILVHGESVQGRRVWMDFRRNPEGYGFAAVPEEAREYLERSGARQATPLERLRHMNPGAIDLYREHGIDLEKEPLEIAVCAQHNNGGLAGNHWYESANIRHLFPVGEVNGSHGVARPGGSALNAGQAGAFRAAEYIGRRYAGQTLDYDAFRAAAIAGWDAVDALKNDKSRRKWQADRAELQKRMSDHGSHLRNKLDIDRAVNEAAAQLKAIDAEGYPEADIVEGCRTRQLCLAHWVYLSAIQAHIDAGAGSRGSAQVSPAPGAAPRGEDVSFREKLLTSVRRPDGSLRHEWVDRRPIPEPEDWFETVWADYRDGRIYD